MLFNKLNKGIERVIVVDKKVLLIVRIKMIKRGFSFKDASDIVKIIDKDEAIIKQKSISMRFYPNGIRLKSLKN